VLGGAIVGLTAVGAGAGAVEVLAPGVVPPAAARAGRDALAAWCDTAGEGPAWLTPGCAEAAGVAGPAGVVCAALAAA